MKTETFTRCEFCNEFISLQSPPSNEQYENAQIHLAGFSTVLLPKKIAKKNSHSKIIDGYYCSPHCLLNQIALVLNKKPKELLSDVKPENHLK